jgi:beta-galactosidase GanA
MKNLLLLVLVSALLGCAGGVEKSSTSAIPSLRIEGSRGELLVDGKPYIMLGGELDNSTASDLGALDSVFAHLRKLGLNTVLTPVYWELLEPDEGKFDFTHVDAAIASARRYDLRLVFLWFGSWKNSMSCYAPMWIKSDDTRFPRARQPDGRPMEIMSAHSPANLSADSLAVCALLSHLSKTDVTRRVIMLQVENEIGMIPFARDHSPVADAAFHSAVPEELIAYLKANSSTLDPTLRDRWVSNGSREAGDWETVFGAGLETDELFTAWYYGRYVEVIAAAAKSVYPLPLYVNAALDSRGRKPGAYPSGGPLSHLIDIWRASAPSIDFIAPDIYDPGFTDWCRRYHMPGNPLFIPETHLSSNNGAQVFYALGRHKALGYSPYAIENALVGCSLSQSYALLSRLQPWISAAASEDRLTGFWFDGNFTEDTVIMGDYRLTGRHVYTYGWSPASKDGSRWSEAGVLVIQLSSDEFLVAGNGVAVTFDHLDSSFAGISSVDLVEIHGDRLTPIRRLNGDQSHQGRHLRIEVGSYQLQHIHLYKYGR